MQLNQTPKRSMDQTSKRFFIIVGGAILISVFIGDSVFVFLIVPFVTRRDAQTNIVLHRNEPCVEVVGWRPIPRLGCI